MCCTQEHIAFTKAIMLIESTITNLKSLFYQSYYWLSFPPSVLWLGMLDSNQQNAGVKVLCLTNLANTQYVMIMNFQNCFLSKKIIIIIIWSNNFAAIIILVPLTGIEPVRCCQHRILSPRCLPVPPQWHMDGQVGFEPTNTWVRAMCFTVEPLSNMVLTKGLEPLLHYWK